ncbi:MAG: AzlD domain-containing protein [Desertimonas sp.]
MGAPQLNAPPEPAPIRLIDLATLGFTCFAVGVTVSVALVERGVPSGWRADPGQRVGFGRRDGRGAADVMMTWLVIGALAVGTWGQRLFGMFGLGTALARRPHLAALADLLPVAIVAAVIAQLTVGDGRGVVLDDRLVGVGVAGVLVWRKAPLFGVVVAAAAVTALARSF